MDFLQAAYQKLLSRSDEKNGFISLQFLIILKC